jgi:alpha-beta hydrolase superfamily lysophospholipase
MRRRLAIVSGLFLVAIVIMAFGPRPPIDETVRFDAKSVGGDVELWLKAQEAAVPGLKNGVQKEIVWADPVAKARTPLALIYVHGFSATKWEIRPLADKAAAALGANLYYTRLTGHGGSGEALAAATLNDWINDLAEAIAVGERIGDRLIVIGTSTGATLATWAADRPDFTRNVAGLVLISPNYEVNGASIGLLNMPWGMQLLPKFYGETRSFEPVNESHGKWWTTRYPSRAVFSMAALLKAVKDKDAGRFKVPALFLYSPDDKVVDANATLRKIAAWGGPTRRLEIANSGDPSRHVIAGDILSPQTTDPLAAEIIGWVRALPN